MQKFISAITLTVILFTFSATAQKLPNKQKENLRAPANIKIDGKATEWNDKFQAYNNATDIFYTMSNGDENLYFSIKVSYQEVINKLLRGGLTVTINSTRNKKDKKQVSVTYPVLRDADMVTVTNTYLKKVIEYKEAKGAEIKVENLNQTFEAKEKMIEVSGITAIPDTSISIYNEYGIKTTGLFDTHLNYTYEFAIPIKYLSLPNDGKEAFSYQVKFNVPPPLHLKYGDPLPTPVPISTIATTDFWGEYTLAEK